MYGDIVLDMINHFYEKIVTLPSNYSRPWKLSIYCHHALAMA